MKTKTAKMLPKILPGSVHCEFKKCGKSNCKCARGALHGPYYYHYLRLEGKLKKRYLKADEVEPTMRACLARQDLEKNQQTILSDGWMKLRALRADLRELKHQPQ